jgi:diaminopimelate decarboxylase
VPGSYAAPAARLELFPVTTQIAELGGSSELTIAGQSLVELSYHYGTPLYIYDQATLDSCLATYLLSLSRHYPGSSGITYAGKAFLCLAMAQWVGQNEISLDCSSAGELHIADQAGLSRGMVIAHGVNKSPAYLEAAIQLAGTVVIDNLHELDRLISLSRGRAPSTSKAFPDSWLRLRPGVGVQTHNHIQTGQPDSKFGLSPKEFLRAVQLCLDFNLPLKGLHFHLGSHLHSSEPVIAAIEIALDLIQDCQLQTGWLPDIICPGGGWGVPYHESDLPHLPLETFVRTVAQALASGCHTRKLPLFHLQLEPGRSLVAQSGVAVYRIGAIKNTPSRRYLLIDGGLADNPRPALYQARYTALPVYEPMRPATSPSWLAGPFCESGDILIHNLPLPELNVDELIAFPVSGAYQLSMSSNYNGASRPAVLWLNNGLANLVQTREPVADLSRRDLPLSSASV